MAAARQESPRRGQARSLITGWWPSPRGWSGDVTHAFPPTRSGQVERGAAVGVWPCIGLEGTGLQGTEWVPAWAARQRGSGDLREGPAPAEALSLLCSQLRGALVLPAEEDRDPLRQVPLSRGPLGVLQGGWDPRDPHGHCPSPDLARKVRSVRRAEPDPWPRVSPWELPTVSTCARGGACVGLPLAGWEPVRVCARACVSCFPRSLPASLSPRGAGTIRVTARTARTACAPPCPPTPAPAPPRASCCGGGGSKSAVSASPRGVSGVPRGGRGQPAVPCWQGGAQDRGPGFWGGAGFPCAISGRLPSWAPWLGWGSGTARGAGGGGPGAVPAPLTPAPRLRRQGRGLLPQLTDLPVQPDHLPAHLPLALRGRHPLPQGLCAGGRLRLPRPHLPGREGPLCAPGQVLLLSPRPLPGGRGSGPAAGGAMVGGLGLGARGDPRARPPPRGTCSLPASSPQRLPERQASVRSDPADRPS